MIGLSHVPLSSLHQFEAGEASVAELKFAVINQESITVESETVPRGSMLSWLRSPTRLR